MIVDFWHVSGVCAFLLWKLGWMKPGWAVRTFGAIPKCFLTSFKYPLLFQRGKAKTFDPELKLIHFIISKTAVHTYVGLFQELISKTAKWSSITLPQLVGYRTYLTANLCSSSYGVPLCSSMEPPLRLLHLQPVTTTLNLHSFKLASLTSSALEICETSRPDWRLGFEGAPYTLDLHKTV